MPSACFALSSPAWSGISGPSPGTSLLVWPSAKKPMCRLLRQMISRFDTVGLCDCQAGGEIRHRVVFMHELNQRSRERLADDFVSVYQVAGAEQDWQGGEQVTVLRQRRSMRASSALHPSEVEASRRPRCRSVSMSHVGLPTDTPHLLQRIDHVSKLKLFSHMSSPSIQILCNYWTRERTCQ